MRKTITWNNSKIRDKNTKLIDLLVNEVLEPSITPIIRDNYGYKQSVDFVKLLKELKRFYKRYNRTNGDNDWFNIIKESGI